MHVGDTIFIFCLALIIFGPKKLPEIGRQIGKLMVEFRRASNEFKMQIEEELRASDESERQKEIAAASLASASVAESAVSGAAIPSGEAVSSSIPVIAPPSTGLPVNHTFPSTEDSLTVEAAGTEAAVSSVSEDAYPEPVNGFNPGLNTASNGLVAETVSETYEEIPVAAAEFPAAESTSPLAQELESREIEAEKAQAPVHHG